MLQCLHVKNLALIDEMEVELKNGLNILTGETGAGKSIILGSINLALGGRYSSDILRSEDEPGLVELTFWVENESQIALLEEKEIYPNNAIYQYLTITEEMKQRYHILREMINVDIILLGDEVFNQVFREYSACCQVTMISFKCIQSIFQTSWKS